MSLLPVDLINREAVYHPGVVFLPFHMEHLERIKVTQPEVLALSKGVNMKTMIRAQSEMGVAITAFLYGTPVAILGCVLCWEGVGEMWMIIDERARTVPVALTKSALRLCDIFEIYLRLHRLQITVRKDDRRAVRWAQRLGFNTEGLMLKYGPDQSDFYLMAR
jgi:ribosomal protein S18 acetylase RimI-like enzyme